MTSFKPSLKKRKEIIKRVCKNSPSWRIRILCSVILFLFAGSIIIGAVILLLKHPTSADGVFIILCAGVCLACVPFFIAISVKNTAKYKCSLPYSSYANGTIVLNGSTMEYIYWKVGRNEPAAYSSKRAVYRDEDKFVYRIERSAVKKLKIDDIGICCISGNGFMIRPDYACGNERSYSNKQIACKEFSFALAFEEDNIGKIINNWKDGSY